MGHHPGGSLGPDIFRLDYDGSGNVIYIGIAHPKETADLVVWQLRKLTYDGSGNVLTVFYADGDKNFDNIWDNRAGYTYS